MQRFVGSIKIVLFAAGCVLSGLSQLIPDLSDAVALLMVVGGALLAIGVVLYEFARAIWLAAKNFRSRPNLTLSEDENTYITDAMRHVAFQSRKFDPLLANENIIGEDGTTREVELRALTAIEQAARDGKLAVRGRRQVSLAGDGFDATFNNIEPSFWSDSKISNGAFELKGFGGRQTEPKNTVAFIVGGHTMSETLPYTDLEVCTDQLKTLFPEKGLHLKLWEALARPVKEIEPDEWQEIDALPVRIRRGPLTWLRHMLFPRKRRGNDPLETLRRAS